MKSLFILVTLILLLMAGCITDSKVFFQSGLNPDTLKILYLDPMDSSQVVYFQNDTGYFADFPPAFQRIHKNYCGICHSSLFHWLNSTNPKPQRPIMDTWVDINTMGAGKYYLAGRSGSMDRYLTVKVPETLLDSMNLFLARASTSGKKNPQSITGFSDPDISRIVNNYCARCHGTNGIEFRKANLSTRERWGLVAVEVCFQLIEDKKMPADGSEELFLWNSNPDDQRKLKRWVRLDLMGWTDSTRTNCLDRGFLP